MSGLQEAGEATPSSDPTNGGSLPNPGRGKMKVVSLHQAVAYLEATMDEEQLKQHIPILGILHLLGGGLFAVLGAFVFLFLSGIGLAVQDPVALRVLTVVGVSVGIFLLILGVPGVVAGYGLLRRRSWARSLAIALGALNLVNVPIGTVIGIYTLVVLLQNDAEEYFVVLKQA